MKKRRHLPWQQLFILIMLLAGIVVVAVLACKSIEMQQKARCLSGAVIAADNASAAFYASDDTEKMAELLHGTAEGNTVTLICDESGMQHPNGTLLLTAERDSSSDTDSCSVKVHYKDNVIFTLECTKARVAP